MAPNAIDRFLEAARALGVEPEVNVYPEGTRTAVDAAAAVGCDVAQIVKSLVFMAGDDPVLALTSGANRVDTGLLGKLCDASIGRADADAVRAATGFSIGGIPPFGHTAPIRTFVDSALVDFETVWAAAGRADTCFAIAPDRLIAASDGTVADFVERAD